MPNDPKQADDLDRMTAAVKELFYWQTVSDDRRPWFHYRLYTLIQMSDPANRARIAKGFPWEVEAFSQWERFDGDEWDFFKKFGFERKAPTALSSRPKPEGHQAPDKNA